MKGAGWGIESVQPYNLVVGLLRVGEYHPLRAMSGAPSSLDPRFMSQNSAYCLQKARYRERKLECQDKFMPSDARDPILSHTEVTHDWNAIADFLLRKGAFGCCGSSGQAFAARTIDAICEFRVTLKHVTRFHRR